ncbi:hypothetical protein A8C56_02770 [Niabella ginsenosidivorans]|uniref:Uncharacterized protein n=1 Tax=Niabella ginsenosidivorans TaxID=1176587 RepID=A0A1A9HXD2_9BACT|nr:hypothetical protein [Niabella ginsenosidivorans]ANH80046.1 hypothetical protein A8C56_02770 [Niabella ginsenosidivorans]
MFTAIKNNIITIKEAVGLDVHIQPDDRWLFSAVYVKITKGKLIKAADYPGVRTIKELKNRLPPNVPVAVCINGKGILMRETDTTVTNLVNLLFPGSNPGDFYSVPLTANETKQFNFICRKTLVEQVLQQLKNAGIEPVAVSIGVTLFLNILPFLAEEALEIPAPSYTITVKNKACASIIYRINSEEHTIPSLNIGGFSYTSPQVNLLATVLDLLLKPADWQGGAIVTPEITAARQNYKYYKLFSFTKWAVLSVTLFLLLVNFFVFSYYFNKNKAVVQQGNLVKETSQANALESARSDSSYAFFVNAGWNKNTRHGFFIDRIAALAPPTVQFTLLQTAPVQESLGTGDFLFSNNKIILSGISSDPTDLEIFSRAVKNIPGVVTVTLNNYLYKRDLAAAVFTIEITVKV